MQINDHGQVLMDTFVLPHRPVTNYRTQWSGVRKEDLNGAPSFAAVRNRVVQLLKGRVIVGHTLTSDFNVRALSSLGCRVHVLACCSEDMYKRRGAAAPEPSGATHVLAGSEKIHARAAARDDGTQVILRGLAALQALKLDIRAYEVRDTARYRLLMHYIDGKHRAQNTERACLERAWREDPGRGAFARRGRACRLVHLPPCTSTTSTVTGGSRRKQSNMSLEYENMLFASLHSWVTGIRRLS